MCIGGGGGGGGGVAHIGCVPCTVLCGIAWAHATLKLHALMVSSMLLLHFG